MKRYFLENNNIRKQLIKKFSDCEEKILENQEDRCEYLRYLLYLNGNSFYVPQNIDLKLLVEELINWFKTEHNVDAVLTGCNQIKILTLNRNSKIAKFLNIDKQTSLILDKNDTYFSFMFIEPEWFKNPIVDKKLEKTNFFANFFNDNIDKFIFNYLYKQNNKQLEIDDFVGDNVFIENLNPKYFQFFLSDRQNYEILLAWLSVSSIKKTSINIDFFSNIQWFYLLTNFDSLLLAFDKNGDIVDQIDLQNRNLTYKKSVRNYVTTDVYSWIPTLSNTNLFNEIVDIASLESERRLNEIAKLNVTLSKYNPDNVNFSKLLLKSIDDVTTSLTTFLLDYNLNKTEAVKTYTEQDKLSKIILEVLNAPNAAELLQYWYKDWQPTSEQSIFILKIFTDSAENKEHLNNILLLHKLIYDDISKKETDEINKILYDIEYCRLLIALEKNHDAEKIINYRLKHTQKDDIFNLLPPENIDPTGMYSGQFLKVILLELLSLAQCKEKSTATLQQIAMLQPLTINNVYNLTKVENETLKTKSNQILSILKGDTLQKNENFVDLRFKKADLNIIEKIKKIELENKNTIKSFSKWLSSYKIPDFTTIKNYADRFSPVKYPQIASVIADLLNFFNLGSVEVFVSHGEYSVGIRAYESETSFLIIGSEHLNTDSPNYLTINEFKFALAVEFAYLYFNFARITSSDIWRGTMEKGIFVVENLISLIPFAGSLTSVAISATKTKMVSQFFAKDEQIVNLLTKGQKVINISNKSSGVLSIANQMLNVIKNILPKQDEIKKEELIFVSRIMQIIADRVGMIFCNDMNSAVRSVFLTTKSHTENLIVAQKYGLNNLLLKKNDKDEYININQAVRFASMFSFWLSDEFESIRKNIIEPEKK